MKYAELDDRAQERAKERWLVLEPHDDWWDCTYEDAITVGALMGIEIGTESVRVVNGKSYDRPSISFSGFWSQGDGCCFSGYLRVADMAGAVEKVKGYAGEDELFRLAAVAEDIFARIAAVQMAQALVPDDDNDYPECSPSMSIQVNGQERSFSTSVDGNEIPNELEEICDKFVADFATWIYNSLEAEHDHLTSEESFKEWVESNDPDYDEDGNPE